MTAPVHPARPPGQTPSQTVGPYFSMVLAPDEAGGRMATADTPGEHVCITGVLLDGQGAPIEDGLIEVWQANAAGRYRHPSDDRADLPLDPGFAGFGRVKTAFGAGTFAVYTIRPGRVPGLDGGLQAPHLCVVVQGRGMLNPVWTRLYFGDEAEANAVDPVLAAVPADRRATLVAPQIAADPVPTFRFDIRMQGADQTAFLEW